MKRKLLYIGPLLILTLIVGVARLHNPAPAPSAKTTVKAVKVSRPVAVDNCQGHVDKTIVVSIRQRHLWACQADHSAYDSPVVTGDMNQAANLTPPGTYTIYAKQTDRHLRGSDDKGSWDDYVHYWMPFLDNQYGAYGFHDATWRSPNDFGNIDPHTSQASHGCVELPLATSQWLYNWSVVGTAVIIQA